MTPLTVAELQKEFCPRISAANLLELLDIKQTKFSRPKVVTVDIRPPEEYPWNMLYKIMICMFGHLLVI